MPESTTIPDWPENAAPTSSFLVAGWDEATGGPQFARATALQSSDDQAFLSDANAFTALNTFNAGIKFAHETLNYYDEGLWTPVVADATTAGNVASTAVAYGEYIRIGKFVHADCRITSINTAGMTAGNAFFVRGLPFAMASNTNYRATGAVSLGSIAFTGYVTLNTTPSGTWVGLLANTTGAAVANLLVSAITSGSGLIQLSIDYIAG